jgi:hypothetical protein
VGAVHCSGKIPQVCGPDGRWVDGQACAYACQNGCVNRFSAISSGFGSPTDDAGRVAFGLNGETFFSEAGTLLGARGFNVAVLDPGSGRILEPVRNFDPWISPLSGHALEALADYLEALEPGLLVMIATCDDAGITPLNSCQQSGAPAVQRVVRTLEQMGSTQIGAYCSRGAWSFLTLTGQRRALAEKISTGSKVTAEALLPVAP